MINDTDGLPQEPGFISRATYSAMCKSQRETQRRLDQAEREREQLRQSLADHKAAIRAFLEARAAYDTFWHEDRANTDLTEANRIGNRRNAAEARLRELGKETPKPDIRC